jgi:hypothetical protein
MNGSGLRNLMLVTGVLAVFAVWMWYAQRSSDTPPGAGEKVFPGLTAVLNDVDRVMVEGADGTFTLRKRGGEWFVEEWGGFPAKFETVKATVVGTEALVIDAPKTKRPDRWNDLGVEEPGMGGTSLRLQLGAGGETVADLVVGRMKGRDAVYVRRLGEDQAWLAKGRLAPPRMASGWVDADILTLPAERIQRVVIQHPDGERLTILRTGDASTDWELRELELGHELLSPGLLSSVASAMSRLTLESVVPAGDIDAAAPEWTSTRFETMDGIAVTVRTAEVDGITVARLSAEALAEEPADLEGPPAEGAADPERSAEEIAAEVAELNAQAGTWTYVLPDWKLQSLVKRMDDLAQPGQPAEDSSLDLLESLGSGGAADTDDG